MTARRRVGPDETPLGLLGGLPLEGTARRANSAVSAIGGTGSKVNFGPPRHGWIDARIEFGEQCFELSLSDVYDPFAEMLCWLEALCTAVERCGFDINDEALIHHFDACRSFGAGEVVFSVMRRDWMWSKPTRCLPGMAERVAGEGVSLRDL